MSEDNIEEFYLPIRDLVKESLIRDIIIFTFIFVLINTQGWDNIFLLLFPIITFGFSLFFRIINTNKWRTEFESTSIIYNPFGLEKKHANRLFFSALFQLILLFWIGAESLYHPHLVEGYFLYFSLLFFFLFSFGFFWIFIDLWKHSRIEIIPDKKLNRNSLKHKSNESTYGNVVLSFLSVKNFRMLSLSNLVVFIVLNILNLLFSILILTNTTLGSPLILPGTGSMGSAPLTVSALFYILLIVSPLLTTVSLIFNYREVNKFNREDLDKIIKNFPPNVQIQIVENLKGLNEKIKEQLKIE